MTRPPQRSLPPHLLLLASHALLLLLTGCQAQQPAPESTCRSKYASFNQNDLVIRLAPCQSGASASCCDAGQNLAGFRANAPLPGCLCYQGTLEELLMTAETNALARSAGVTRQLIISILQQCGTPYYGGSGAAACPAAGSSQPPSGNAPAPGPAPAGGRGPAPAPAPRGPAPPTRYTPPASGGGGGGGGGKAPEYKKAEAPKKAGLGFGHGQLLHEALKWHEENHPLIKALNHG